jgi:inosose dehydratase
LCYLPLGEGVVDIPAILEILAEINYDGYAMVELDGTPRAPYAPKEAAAISKRYLQNLGQRFVH